MFIFAVDGQLHAVVPGVIQQEVHIVNLVDVRIVDSLFLHLPCHHIQILHHIVGGTVLVDAQLESLIRLHAAVAHEDEGTIVLDDLLEL